MTGQRGGPIGALSVLETHAKAFLVGLFGIPPAAVLVALEGAGVTLPTWATALLALLPIIAAVTGVVIGPANAPAAPAKPDAIAELSAAIEQQKAAIAAARAAVQNPPTA